MTRLPFYLISFFLAAVLGGTAGCGGDDSDLPEVDCEGSTVPSYSEVAIFQDVCTGCHSSDLTGTDRNAAPDGVNFDTEGAASMSAEEGARQVFLGNMPPETEDNPPQSQKDQFYLWALCP